MERLALPILQTCFASISLTLLAAATLSRIAGAHKASTSDKLAGLLGAAIRNIVGIFAKVLADRRHVTENVAPHVTSVALAPFALVIIQIGDACVFMYVRGGALVAVAEGGDACSTQPAFKAHSGI